MRESRLKLKVLYVIDRREDQRRCTCAQCIAYQLHLPPKNIHKALKKYKNQYLVKRSRLRAQEHPEWYYGLLQYRLTDHGRKRLKYLQQSIQVELST